MRNTILVMLLSLGACDQRADDISSRDGSTGGSTAAPEMTVPPCECAPEDANPCGPGLSCVPIGGGHACLAPCSALTTCAGPCLYPFFSEMGTGPAFCSTCVTCVSIEAMACQ